MIFKIIGKNVEITDSIRDRVEKKISSLDKFLTSKNKNAEARVSISVTRDYQKIEVTIGTKWGIIRAEDRDSDLYKAIDNVEKKLFAQFSRVKSQILNKKKLAVAKAFDWEAVETSPVEEPVVEVKTKILEIAQITRDDAIAEMELSGHDFYIYFDSVKNKTAVAYKRKDGGYGIIYIQQ
jgi:putative sigma-54 modulation protein